MTNANGEFAANIDTGSTGEWLDAYCSKSGYADTHRGDWVVGDQKIIWVPMTPTAPPQEEILVHKTYAGYDTYVGWGYECTIEFHTPRAQLPQPIQDFANWIATSAVEAQAYAQHGTLMELTIKSIESYYGNIPTYKVTIIYTVHASSPFDPYSLAFLIIGTIGALIVLYLLGEKVIKLWFGQTVSEFPCQYHDGFVAKTAGELELHKKNVHGEIVYICPLCGASFPTAEARDKHMKEVHNVEKINWTLIGLGAVGAAAAIGLAWAFKPEITKFIERERAPKEVKYYGEM